MTTLHTAPYEQQAHPSTASMTFEAPLIARIAGLPTRTIAAFVSHSCQEPLDRLLQANRNLEAARVRVVEDLYPLVSAAPPQARRALLAIKRDCFNRRSLARHQEKLGQLDLPSSVEAVIRSIHELEQRCIDSQADLETVYRLQKEQERHAMIAVLESSTFVRGMALGSLTTATNSWRLRRNGSNRRTRRLELTLARYLTRTALKLSPQSTLTPVALGLVHRAPADSPLELNGADRWKERSFCRLRRFLIDQVADMLLRYPSFYRHLPVTLNGTLDEIEPGRLRFLKPSRWEHADNGTDLEEIKPALVKAGLDGPLIAWLRQGLGSCTAPYADLAEELAQRYAEGSIETAQRTLDQLLGAGLLRSVPPWGEQEPVLENHVLTALTRLQGSDEGLIRLGDAVRQLTQLTAAYDKPSDPASVISVARQAHQHAKEIWQLAAPLGGLKPSAQLATFDGRFLNEDVILTRQETTSESAEETRGEVVRIGFAKISRALSSLEPIARLSNLLSWRQDFLTTLSAFTSKHWSDSSSVGFLSFFETVQPLFRSYIKFLVDARNEASSATRAFNPMDLEQIEQARATRLEIVTSIQELLTVEHGECRMDPRDLSSLLDTKPEIASETPPFSAILQPLDSSGDHWVMNGFFEGVGRHSCRYTTAMPPIQQEFWAEHFKSRSSFERNGEIYEYTDILCPAGNNANLHIPQTPKVICTEPSLSGLPPHRAVGLRDLTVRIHAPGRPPEIVDPASGHILLPIHLGGLVFRFLPNLFKFLTMFGPGKLQKRLPRARPEPIDACAGEVYTRPRHLLDNVVYLREHWSFSPHALGASLNGKKDERLFYALNDWRLHAGIPQQVYLQEPLGGGSNPQRKPQFIDFYSPTLVAIFANALHLDVPRMSLSEALPAPADLPLWTDGEQRAVELQIDHQALQQEFRP